MKKVLEMVFRTVGGKEVVLNLSDPKDNITTQEVVAAMETIIGKNIFATTSGDLRDPVAAHPCDRHHYSCIGRVMVISMVPKIELQVVYGPPPAGIETISTGYGDDETISIIERE